MKKARSFLSLMLFVIFLMLASVFTVANSESFFRSQYRKNGTEKYTGMSTEDLVASSNVLMDYMSGKRDDMYIVAEKFGTPEPVFNERETEHMVDVRNLYVNARRIMYVCLGLSLILAGIMIIRPEGTSLARSLRKSLLPVTVLFAAFGAAMAGFFMFGFNWFWINFHHVFFPNNDLWLLDPKTSTMINMFPEEFFLAMCSRILVMFIALYVLTAAAILVSSRKTKKT